MSLQKINNDDENTRDCYLGESISLAYKISSSNKTDNKNTMNDELSSSFSVPLEYNQMRNIRNEFYLRIIREIDAKELLFKKVEHIIVGLEKSGMLKRYEPSEQDPVYVYKDNANIAKITQSIVTIGTFNWNNIIEDKNLGVSRVHAIIMLMQDKYGKIAMIIIDAWSMQGTYILSKDGLVIESTVGNDRKVLFSVIENYTIIEFSKSRYIFSTNNARTCIICMENNRDIRYDCGHGVVCKDCSIGLNECPICRKSINLLKLESVLCFESFQY
jgi:hypothetical protein